MELIIHYLYYIGNGELDRDEMRTVLESCVEESSLSMDQQQLEELTDILFEESDTEQKGFITFDELQSFLAKFPGIAENLTIRYIIYAKR
jgi:Ca2+-binding EF-hand superfamily protein